MTQRAGRSPAVVATASPAGRPPPRWAARRRWHSSRIAGPPLRWMAPSTPPPPSRVSFAALTIASTFCSVMSPSTTTTRPSRIRISLLWGGGRQPVDPSRHQGRTGDRGRHHEHGAERDQEAHERGHPEAEREWPVATQQLATLDQAQPAPLE